ncbi:MAG: glycerol-3-phosphate dehydrogenase, partial [Bdellovibrionales bacterium]
ADCWADDSRLVVLNAVDAAEKGAAILTHTRCVGVEAAGGVWQVSLLDEKTGEGRKIRASMVVNAAGPWVNDVVGLAPALSGDAALPHVRLVKGSHIIIDRAFDGDQAYILQQPDKRIVFVIPYEGRFTLIGTTEEDFNGDVYAPMLSEGELTYLVDAYNRSFKRSIAKDDVLWSYSGVRPLFDTGDVNATSASRDYKFYNHPDTVAPFVSVFGGKLTTYRVLAERLVNQLLHLDNRYAPPWTAGRPLPGGDIKCDDFAAFLTAQKRRYAWLPDVLLSRYARAYGTRMDVFLDGAQSLSDLGRSFGDDVYEAEIVYMLRYEFAREAEDLLWRRSKLGLHAGDKTVQAVSDYVARYHRNKARYG